jgi:hypothetical protein
LVPETESCDAILQAWYAGESGGQAIADVLFGDLGLLVLKIKTNNISDTFKYYKDKKLTGFRIGFKRSQWKKNIFCVMASLPTTSLA